MEFCERPRSYFTDDLTKISEGCVECVSEDIINVCILCLPTPCSCLIYILDCNFVSYFLASGSDNCNYSRRPYVHDIAALANLIKYAQHPL